VSYPLAACEPADTARDMSGLCEGAKNDDRSVEAIAEAAIRPSMRFGPPRDPAQLDMQTLHRGRERLMAERTALINQIRRVLG
jgi:transposase